MQTLKQITTIPNPATYRLPATGFNSDESWACHTKQLRFTNIFAKKTTNSSNTQLVREAELPKHSTISIKAGKSYRLNVLVRRKIYLMQVFEAKNIEMTSSRRRESYGSHVQNKQITWVNELPKLLRAKYHEGSFNPLAYIHAYSVVYWYNANQLN